MRVALLLLVLASIARAVPLAEVGELSKAYPRFIDFPDGEGKLHRVDLEEEVDMDLIEEIEKNPANNVYLLFTRAHPTTGQRLEFGVTDSILNSDYNPQLPTAVISHGWLSNQNSDINPVITKALLASSDVNVIVLDWRRLALAPYTTAVRGVPAIGRGLGRFIRFLCDTTGAQLADFHLIGFSLGAHVVGNAGRELGGAVARVTGLDPAGPLWNLNRDCLNPNDAVYVEAIHTNGGVTGLGIGSDVGDADFYPNGGSSQPGCLTTVCDHNRAWELFASTVSYNHLEGNQCSSSLQLSLNNCRGALYSMGNNDLHKFGSGKFRVNTRRRYPY